MAANTASDVDGTISVVLWTPPPLDSWIFRDCSLYAKYAIPIIRQADNNGYDVCYAEPDTMYHYLLSGIPPGYPMPKERAAVLWYQYFCSPDRGNAGDPSHSHALKIINRMFTKVEHGGFPDASALEVCKAQLQSELGIGGNVDIAGLGATASYCIQAPLATVYAAAQLMDLLGGWSRTPGAARRFPRLRAVLSPFRATLSTFFSSTVLLSLGTLLASINTLAVTTDDRVREKLLAWRTGAEFSSFYDIYLAALASAFCSFPVFSTGLLLQQRSRRRRLVNISAILTIIILLLVVLFWSFDLHPMPKDLAWQSYQIDLILGAIPDPRTPIITIGMVLLLAFLLGGLPTYFVALRYRWAQEPLPRWGLPRAYKIFISIVMQVFFLFMMWFTFARFLDLRHAILDISGGKSSMTEWAFGQILALATWIPVVVDISYTSIYGNRKGLEAHMPPNYEARLKRLIRARTLDVEMAGFSTVGTQTDPQPPDSTVMGSVAEARATDSPGGDITTARHTDLKGLQPL